MKRNISQSWISAAYKTFAYEGPAGLKVEKLARELQKNKSSFYHLFSDKEGLLQKLLEHHLTQATLMAEKERNCSTQQELIEIILEHKIDLLFNRQLRIHRSNTDFESCFCKTNQLAGEALIGIWSTVLDLKENTYLAQLVMKFSLENFFLQITDETINKPWLNNYIDDLKQIIRAMQKKSFSAQLDGSV